MDLNITSVPLKCVVHRLFDNVNVTSPTSVIEKFGKNSEEMEGFCFVISITDPNRPNMGNEDDEV